MAADESATLPVARVGGPSLTSRVLHAIVQAIRAGSFPDGRLPPEDKLAEMLGVSRTTLRRALQSLDQIGLIDRRPGRGTRLRSYVSTEILALHGLVPFPVMLREQGHEVESTVDWQRLETTVPRLEERLDRAVEGGVYEVHTLLRADGVPAVSLTEWIPEDCLAKAPTDEDFQLGSLMLLSERTFREPIVHAVADLEPSVATASDPLALEPGRPYVTLIETFYSVEDTPLAVSEVAVNSDLVTFTVFRRLL